MNTQTFAQAQDLKAIADEELMAVNGGGAWATLGWAVANVPTLGIPMMVDMGTGNNVTFAAADY